MVRVGDKVAVRREAISTACQARIKSPPVGGRVHYVLNWLDEAETTLSLSNLHIRLTYAAHTWAGPKWQKVCCPKRLRDASSAPTL